MINYLKIVSVEICFWLFHVSDFIYSQSKLPKIIPLGGGYCDLIYLKFE